MKEEPLYLLHGFMLYDKPAGHMCRPELGWGEQNEDDSNDDDEG